MTIVAMLATASAFAQTPVDGAFTYQGQLQDQGQPASGPYNMQFRLYAANTGGTPLATYPPGGPMAVTVQDGLFTAIIDFGMETFNGERRWLEVVVEGVTLAPRQELTVTPYALYALNGPGGESFWQGSPTGNGIYYNAGNVGIGADPTPNHLLEVAGDDVLISTPGGGNANLILNDTDGGSTPPGIAFWGNTQAGFYGPDTGDQIFAFRAGYPTPRVHDVRLRVYGHEDTQFIDLMHDGSAAVISSMPGDLVLLPAGNVGIGTAAPARDLELRKTVDGLLDAGVENDSSHPDARAMFAVGCDITQGSFLAHSSTNPNPAQNERVAVVAEVNAAGLSLVASDPAGDIRFHTAGFGDATQRMVIDPDGLLGIGTADPQARLHIGGTPGTDGIMFPDGTLQTTAATGGEAGWSLTGNAGTVPGVNFLGTTDNQPLILKANGLQVIRLEPTAISPNVIAGFADNQVLSGVVGATIAGGGRPDDGVGDPEYNWVRAHHGTIAGGVANRVGASGGPEDGQYATVGGGDFNNASGEYSAIAGGHSNWAGGAYASIPGGLNVQAGGDYSFAAGREAKVRSPIESGDPDGDEGTFVWADSTDADFISTGPNRFLVRATGGVNFVVDADPNTGGGLRLLPVVAPDAYGNRTPNIVNGFLDNSVTASAVGATIAGGGAAEMDGYARPNVVTDHFGTVGGGIRNQAGDGDQYAASATWATVSGGLDNSATGTGGTIGGGGDNAATGDYGTIGGGGNNLAAGGGSTVGGGEGNRAIGLFSTVPGGLSNKAGGHFSFAAGYRAKVRDPNEVGDPNDLDGDQGTFVWADASDLYNDFTSTGPNQFLVRATGFVGINTNAPTSPLTVNGVIESLTGGFRFPDDSVQTTAGVTGSGTAGYLPKFTASKTVGSSILYEAAGKIGINDTAPDGALDITSSLENTLWLRGPGEFTTDGRIRFQDGSPDVYIQNDTDGGLLLSVDDAYGGRLAVTGGNVGIGTLDPNNALSVAGDADFTGAVGIGTASPSSMLTVAGNADFTGNVGIGTPSPRTPLDVFGSVSVERALDQLGGINWYEAGTNQWIFPFFRGWQSDNLIVRDEAGGRDTMTFQALTGNVGIGNSDPGYPLHFASATGAKICFYGPAGGANTGIGITSSALAIHTNTSSADMIFGYGSIGSFTENVRFKGTGNVGIGVDPSEKLDVNGTARLRGLGTSTGTAVVADANGKLWKQSSSLRYKHNITDLPLAGDAVLDLRPVSFEWNSTGEADIGLIAEEVEQLLPDLVIRDAAGQPDGVRYDKVSLYLLGVVKNQSEKLASQNAQLATQEEHIAAQQAHIQAQQDELTNLRARFEKIEALLAGHVAQPTGGVR